MAPFRNKGRGEGGGPKLPAALQEELYGPAGAGKKSNSTYAGNRKEMRKQARHPAKFGGPQGSRMSGPPAGRPLPIVRAEPVERRAPPPPPPPLKRKIVAEPTKSEGHGKKKITATTSTPLSRMLGEAPPVEEESEVEDVAPKKKKKKAPLELPSSMGGAGGGKEEDDEIEWLEWKLGIKGKKGKGKSKAKTEDEDLDDGLDDLLNFADQIGPGGSGYQAGASDDEDQSDDQEESSEMNEGDSDMEDFEDEDEEWGGIQGEDTDMVASDSQDGSDAEEQDEVEKEEAAQGEQSPEVEMVKQIEEVQSTPAAPSDSAAPAGRYIPPHMRAAAAAEAESSKKAANVVTDPAKIEAQRKLERKAQGLLNKLSEANIEAILKEIEELYRGNSRHDVTSTITSLILTMISSKTNLLDSFVVLYATLVGTLYKVIGVEFGAHFLQSLVTQYHTLAATTSLPAADEAGPSTASTPFLSPDAGKQPLNLLVLICELYNAQLVSSKLIYDLIRSFLEGEGSMGEFEVEALLKVLRCCGSQLRTDDPGALKEIVALTQKRTSGHEKDMSSRARFMLETLANVKNNKIKATNGTEQGVEATARMKKFLNGLGKKRQLRAYEPLRVSLNDLLNADTKGKWWLVGAGWSGNPLVDREAEIADVKLGKKKKTEPAALEDEELLQELARKQGMNTDVRRAVFVILMTSEDYEHACDRLLHMNLTEIQQREFVRVTLHCAGLEPTYNPYYTLILQRLCADSYSHRFTLQYALWDFLREMGEAGVGGSGSGAQFGGESDGRSVKVEKAVNIARAVAFGVARGSLDLTLFKPVDFTSLKSKTKTFFRTFFAALCIGTQTPSPSFVLPKQHRPFTADELEEIAQKTLSNLALAQGIFYFLETEAGPKALAVGGKLALKTDRERDVVRQGVEVIKGVVGSAV